MRRRYTLGALLLGLVPLADAAAPVREMLLSSDTALVVGSVTISDDEIAVDELSGGERKLVLPGIPARADVDAFAELQNGDLLLSFDSVVELPAGGSSIYAERGDVVRYDGSDYSVELDASALGISPQVNLDAVTLLPVPNTTELIVSFDQTLVIGTLTVEDSDLVRYDGKAFDTTALFFDSSAAGVARQLDLDGVRYLIDGHLLVSFDSGGEVGGVYFDDDDTLEYDPGGLWTMLYDGSAQHPGWLAADVDAVDVTCHLPSGFADLYVTKAGALLNLSWSAVAGAFAYDLISGDLDVLIATGGNYAVATSRCVANDLNATTWTDIPPAGSIWYLVRAVNECGEGSYGTTRDASISASPVTCP